MTDPDAYLRRIGHSGQLALDPQTLGTLHRAHLLTVPFENLDIARGRRLVVDPETNVRKIVEQKRGGFCYELNGAFAALLVNLGFNVTLLSGRVARKDGSLSPEFDHMALRVDLDEPWLADVGFGDLFLEPILFRTGVEQERDGRIFRLVEDDSSGEERLLLQRKDEQGAWKSEYSLSLRPRHIGEFASMCEFHQTSPESHFTQRSICSLATVDGRITLADRTLIITHQGERQERLLATEDERIEVLRKTFGVILG